MIIWDGMQLVGLAILIIVAVLLGLVSLVGWLRQRQREGWCKHTWRLHSTLSYGPKSRYECTKCGLRKVR